MSYKLAGIGLTASVLLCSASTAAIADGDCSFIMSKGIYDVSRSATSSESAKSFAQAFCNQKFGSSIAADKYAGSLGFGDSSVDETLTGNLGYNQSNESWSQWYAKFCSDTQTAQIASTQLQTFVQKVNSKVLETVQKCLELGSVGVNAWLSTTASPHLFNLHLQYESSGEPPCATINKPPALGTVTCDPPIAMNDRICKPEITYNCKRIDNDAVSLAINTNEIIRYNNGNLILPPIVVWKPIVEVSAGTSDGSMTDLTLVDLPFSRNHGRSSSTLDEYFKFKTESAGIATFDVKINPGGGEISLVLYDDLCAGGIRPCTNHNVNYPPPHIPSNPTLFPTNTEFQYRLQANTWYGLRIQPISGNIYDWNVIATFAEDQS